MVTRCCGFHEGFFLKVSSLSAIMQKFRIRANTINWVRDQLFEQGMVIYIYIEIFIISSDYAWVYEMLENK